MASTTNEWLNPLLENMVQAAYGPQGHVVSAAHADAHSRLGYAHEDLDLLLDMFTLFAQRELAGADPEDGAGAVQRVGEAIVQALEEVATAEHTPLTNPAGSRWDEALVCWRQAGEVLIGLYTRAEQQHRTPLANAAGALAFWIETVGMVYCILRLSLDPWADLTGHSGEEVLWRLNAIERTLLRHWHHNRYQFYSLLARRYSRWAQYARRHGWGPEADAFDFLVQRTRMRTLAAYLRSGRRSFQVEGPSLAGDELPAASRPPPSAWADWRDRLSVLGRLSIDLFYYATARFGYRPARLVWINALVIFVFGLIYGLGGFVQTAPNQPVKDLLQAEYFSALVFMLAALGEISPSGPAGQVLVVLESLWGFLMISVVIATVLNRNTTTPS